MAVVWIIAIFAVFLAFEIGKACGQSEADEKLQQLRQANQALENALDFVQVENEHLKKSAAPKITRIGDLGSKNNKS